MKHFIILFTLLFFITSCASGPQSPENPALQQMGWLELARLSDHPEVTFRAKLDTGAKTSSLHAKNLKRFKRKGKSFVRFTFDGEDRITKEKFSLEYELPVVRTVKIKRHGGKSRTRPVVQMEFLLGGKTHKAQFTLADRSRFHYPMLLGRRFLEDVALVNSKEMFMLEHPDVGGANHGLGDPVLGE